MPRGPSSRAPTVSKSFTPAHQVRKLPGAWFGCSRFALSLIWDAAINAANIAERGTIYLRMFCRAWLGDLGRGSGPRPASRNPILSPYKAMCQPRHVSVRKLINRCPDNSQGVYELPALTARGGQPGALQRRKMERQRRRRHGGPRSDLVLGQARGTFSE